MKKFEGMLLSCDMDGTLLDDNKQIPPDNIHALRYFTEQGGRLSLATGRSPYAVDSYVAQLPVNAPYSVMNGSLICDQYGQTMYCAGMPMQAKQMVEYALLNNSQFGCEIFTAETALIRQMSDYTLHHMYKLHLDYVTLPGFVPPSICGPCFWGKSALAVLMKFHRFHHLADHTVS